MDTPEKYVFHSFLIASIGLGSIITLFILGLARHLRRNLALARANVMAEINAAEKERNRIASDLHDELGPALCAIKLMVSGFEFEDDGTIELQENTDRQLGMLIQRIRGISHDLMPSDLIEQGLHAALDGTLYYAKTASQMEIFTSFDDDLVYTDNQTLHLYRIINEIVHNTMKHARATVMKIELRKSGSRVQLIIKENGIGFDFKELAASGSGHGLKSLLSRTKLLEGKLQVKQTQPGMQYLLTVPYKKK